MKYEIVFVPASLLHKYTKLKESTVEDKTLYNNLTKAFDELEIDPANGKEIPRDRIPTRFRKRHPLMRNCWKYDLPDGWRLIYHIASSSGHRFVVIAKWMSHDEYVRDFNY